MEEHGPVFINCWRTVPSTDTLINKRNRKFFGSCSVITRLTSQAHCNIFRIHCHRYVSLIHAFQLQVRQKIFIVLTRKKTNTSSNTNCKVNRSTIRRGATYLLLQAANSKNDTRPTRLGKHRPGSPAATMAKHQY